MLQTSQSFSAPAQMVTTHGWPDSKSTPSVRLLTRQNVIARTSICPSLAHLPTCCSLWCRRGRCRCGQTFRLQNDITIFAFLRQSCTFALAPRAPCHRQVALVKHFARFARKRTEPHLKPVIRRIKHRTKLLRCFLFRHPSVGTRTVLGIPHCTLGCAIRPYCGNFAKPSQRNARVFQSKGFVNPDHVLVDCWIFDVH